MAIIDVATIGKAEAMELQFEVMAIASQGAKATTTGGAIGNQPVAFAALVKLSGAMRAGSAFSSKTPVPDREVCITIAREYHEDRLVGSSTMIRITDEGVSDG